MTVADWLKVLDTFPEPKPKPLTGEARTVTTRCGEVWEVFTIVVPGRAGLLATSDNGRTFELH